MAQLGPHTPHTKTDHVIRIFFKTTIYGTLGMSCSRVLRLKINWDRVLGIAPLLKYTHFAAPLQS